MKTFHILSVMAWLTGIFYLPRILVHYTEGKEANEDVRRLLLMAQKLIKFMTIMAALAIGLGSWLWLGYGISGGWLHVKLVFVVMLVIYHYACWHYLRNITSGSLKYSGKYFRYFNELSLLFIVPILIMVVVKPI
jgi:putative membrane protein